MKLEVVMGIVLIAGFAIQQVLQIFDPAISALMEAIKRRRANADYPGALTETEFKKASMTFLSFLLGILVSVLTRVRLLALIDDRLGETPGDLIVTALVIGAGTEGFNTFLKYIGYVKDSRKPEPSVEVVIFPSSPTVAKGATLTLHAIVRNSEDQTVEWQVLQSNGGNVDPTGLYTAPQNTGTFHVSARSVADTSKAAIAAVRVT